MATTSIADKLAKLEKKIAKREKAIDDETKELDKDRAEYNKLYIMFLSDKYKLSGKELFSAIEREHEQREKTAEQCILSGKAVERRSRSVRGGFPEYPVPY